MEVKKNTGDNIGQFEQTGMNATGTLTGTKTISQPKYTINF